MRMRISLFLKSCDGVIRLIVFLDLDFCLNYLVWFDGVFLFCCFLKKIKMDRWYKFN